jgi:hypothetical protein
MQSITSVIFRPNLSLSSEELNFSTFLNKLLNIEVSSIIQQLFMDYLSKIFKFLKNDVILLRKISALE